MPKKKSTIPEPKPSATDDHRPLALPGPKAHALWDRFPELFPDTCVSTPVVKKPYPRRRIHVG
jgi:hypothetical protein